MKNTTLILFMSGKPIGPFPGLVGFFSFVYFFFFFGSRPLPDGYTNTHAGTAEFSQLFKTTKSHVIPSLFHPLYMKIG